MKTSSKIIIAYIIFILAGTLGLFIFTEIHENNHIIKKQKKEISLPQFSVIVAEPGSSFDLISGDSNKITINYIKNEKSFLPFVIKNDTLHIIGANNSIKPKIGLLIQCSDVNTIIADHTEHIYIHGFKTDSLTIIADKGKFFLGLKNIDVSVNDDNNIKKLTFIGKNNSFMSIYKSKIDQFTTRLRNSNVDAFDETVIKQYLVEISDSSKFGNYLGNKNKSQMNLKSDESSTYFLNNTIE